MKRLLKVSAWVIVVLAVIGGIAFVAGQQETAAEKYERDRESRCVATFPISSEAEKQDACKHEKDSGRDYLPRWYVLVAWPEGITTWAIIATGLVICWQSWELHEQTRHMLNKERARIDVSFPNGALELDDGPEWTEAMKAVYAGVEITVSNLGATRAFNVAAKANIVGVPQIGSETSNEVSLLSLPSTIEPEAEPIKADVITLLSGIDHIAAVNDGSETLYLEGNVTYEDVFGKRHMTQFRYVWRVSDMPIGEQRVDTSQWEKTEKGNEAD